MPKKVGDIEYSYYCTSGEAGPTVKAPLDVQIGGGHYKNMKIQPIEFIHANNIGYVEGCVIKYVSRWRKKNGIEDLMKAKHFIDLLIGLEGDENATDSDS